jgi:hypothetical protein
MNRFVFLLTMAITLSATIGFSQNSDKIIGAWEMISTKYTYPDSSVREKKEFKYPAIRIYTKTYYSFGYQDENGRLSAAVGGKYSVEGKTLICERNYHVEPSYVGTSTKFEIDFEGDKLIIKGVLPNKIKMEEVYKRVE